MADRLPAGTVRLRTRVDRVTSDSATDYYRRSMAGGHEPIRTREVLVAVPAPITRKIVADLPQWKDAALQAARMPGSTTLCITADVTVSRTSVSGRSLPSQDVCSMR